MSYDQPIKINYISTAAMNNLRMKFKNAISLNSIKKNKIFRCKINKRIAILGTAKTIKHH